MKVSVSWTTQEAAVLQSWSEQECKQNYPAPITNLTMTVQFVYIPPLTEQSCIMCESLNNVLTAMQVK